MGVAIFAVGTILTLIKSRFIPRQPFLYPLVNNPLMLITDAKINAIPFKTNYYGRNIVI